MPRSSPWQLKIQQNIFSAVLCLYFKPWTAWNSNLRVFTPLHRQIKSFCLPVPLPEQGTHRVLLPSSFPTPPAGAGGGISRIPVGRRKVPNQAALAESEAELCCSGGWQNTWNEKVEDGDGRALLESLSLAAINSDFILKAVASTTQNYFSIRLISSSNCKLFFFCSYSPRVCVNLWGEWSSCRGALLFLHCGKWEWCSHLFMSGLQWTYWLLSQEMFFWHFTTGCKAVIKTLRESWVQKRRNSCSLWGSCYSP